MTIHRLTSPGGRKTVCNLNVPGILKVNRTDTVWEDGDQEIGKVGQCVDGCWSINIGTPPEKRTTTDGYDLMNPPKPTAPQRPVLQRFKAMANKPTGDGQVKIGSAITNRDGSINVYLHALAVDGKFFLVPEEP